MQLMNRTPFAGGAFVDTDRHGSELLVLVMKATFAFGGSRPPVLAPVQDPLVFTDIHAGKPGASSLLYESDANWGRQAADVALLAYAYPARTGDSESDVSIRVGALAKTARVFGERSWSNGLAGAHLSSPKPFERLPLTYENAFGGIDHSAKQPADFESEARNPVGRGMRARKSQSPIESVRPPHVEDPQNLISRLSDRPAPVGFTFLAKTWKPRGDFAGTYDAAWQSTRMPLLPTDFDPKFYTAASPELSMPFPVGGETVDLINLTPTRREQFMLPRVDMQASFLVDAAPTPVLMHLDSIVIDAVKSKLVLVWHGTYPVQGLVDDIRWSLVEGGPL